jgi:hypothetical protein
MTYKNGELEDEVTKETFKEKRTITKKKSQLKKRSIKMI